MDFMGDMPVIYLGRAMRLVCVCPLFQKFQGFLSVLHGVVLLLQDLKNLDSMSKT